MPAINYGLLAAQILNILLLLAIIALTVYALVRLNRDNLPAGDKTWWTALIVLFPLLGPARISSCAPRPRDSVINRPSRLSH